MEKTESIWYQLLTEVRVFYFSAVILAGILQDPFYTKNYPKYDAHVNIYEFQINNILTFDLRYQNTDLQPRAIYFMLHLVKIPRSGEIMWFVSILLCFRLMKSSHYKDKFDADYCWRLEG